MVNFLFLTAVVLCTIVVIGFINEKFLKITYEIALLLISVVIGAILTVVIAHAYGDSVNEFLNRVRIFDLEGFLMKGVLCFMLFAGACHLNIRKFTENARAVGVLAFLCTLLGALFYGGLFYLATGLIGLSFDLPVCLMFGSIVAPTDPIAATSILKKFGLPEKTGFLMEGESLLNDGVGVALFVVFSGIVTASESGNFVVIMVKEILGAVVVGTVIMFISYFFFKNTQDGKRRVIISLFAVAASFELCEIMGFSGAIACVVCGVVFSTLRDRDEARGQTLELTEFDSFWEMLDTLLNSALYVILGFTFVRILQMPSLILLSVIAIVCNFIARYGSVLAGSFLIGKIPDGFSRLGFTTLFTWGGLRGGLSIALAMGTAAILQEESHYIILGCTYAIVFFTTVVQGLTMQKVYNKLTAKR